MMINTTKNLGSYSFGIRYIIKEKQQDIVILSSDEEEEEETHNKKRLKLEDLQKGSSEQDPIQLSDDDDYFTDYEAGHEDDLIQISDHSETGSLFLSALSDYADLESDFFSFGSDRELTIDMDPPAQVSTYIPNDGTVLESLQRIEMYLQSITEPVIHANEFDPRASRQNPTYTNTNALELPYVPSQVWTHSTWEDWTQLDVADILHVPFRQDEINALKVLISRKVAKRRKRDELDFWQSIADRLPGRSPIDCRCFWADYLNMTYRSHPHVLMVRRVRQPMHGTIPKHCLLQQRKQTGAKRTANLQKSLWANMVKENTILEGSGDAITLAIYHDCKKGVRVVAGSLCDENIEYNVPGNLRIWDLETEACLSLKGHQTINELTSQAIWRTVTDVKMSNDQELIFSSSHDGSANIWRAKSGKLVSTLRYHSKPINQLAVNRCTNEHIVATCSNDGTATIWYIEGRGKTGSGLICELDQNFYCDPHVECIEFGSYSTDSLLFLGINNNDLTHPGYVEAYDITSGKPRMRFDSMKGCVSTLAVSSSGRYIVSGNYNRYDSMEGDRFIHLHDSRYPKKVIKFYSGHPDVNVVAMSPCERYVASGNADKEVGEVVVYDIRQAKKKLHELKHDQTILDQSLTAPDSSVGIGGLYWMSNSQTMITGGGDSKVKVWNLAGATTLLKEYITSNCVTSLSVHEDTMTMAAGVTGAQGIVHVWQP